MGMKTMVTRGLALSMVGVVAVMSTANYKGDLKTTLESNLNDLETMLAGYSAKFKDQKRQIAQYVAQIGANETTIKNLQDQVKSLTADKTSLTSERNDLKSKLTSIATLLGISTEGKDMDTLVADISNNITNGAEVSSDELATFKTIAKNLGKTEEEVASMSRNELVVFINAEVNSLNAELDEANADIVEYEGKIERANTEIKRLEGIIAQYEADLNALNSKAETIEETYKEEYNNEIKGENQGNVEGGGTPEQPTEPEQPSVPETTEPETNAKEQAYAKLSGTAKTLADNGYQKGDLLVDASGDYHLKVTANCVNARTALGISADISGQVPNRYYRDILNITAQQVSDLNAWAEL